MRFQKLLSIGPLVFVLIALLALVSCAIPGASASLQARDELAWSGKFRVGLYHLNPIQVSQGAQSGNYEGLVIDLGRELASRLGVPFMPVPFTDITKLAECVKMRECDAIVLATDTQIARDFAQSPPFVEFDNSYLVGPASPMRSVADMDRKGMRIAAFTGSAVHVHLKGLLKNAELTTSPRGAERVEWLRTGQIDAIADGAHTLRVLFAPQIPGSRVVEGGFSTTSYVLETAREHRAGQDFLAAAIEDMKRSGQVDTFIRRWSLSARTPPQR